MDQGFAGLAEPMFKSIVSSQDTGLPPGLPTVEKQTDNKVEKFVAKTYDLREKDDLESYQDDMLMLFTGVEKRTHAVLFKAPLQFVDSGGLSGYLAYVEWIEFAKPVVDMETTPVGAGNQDSGE